MNQSKKSYPRYVATPAGRIEYYRFGEGSPVLFIAGYATDITSWNRDLLGVVAQQHQVILINNRDVGGSYSHAASYTTTDLADDTYQFICTLGLHHVTVVGLSMGGMIAQQLAISHPESVSRLVLINTSMAGSQSVRPDPRVEAQLRSLKGNKLGFYAAAVNLFFPPSWKARAAYSLAADRFLPAQYSEIDAPEVMPRQRELVLRWLADDVAAGKIRRLKMPVLVMVGDEDIVIPPKNSLILANTIPQVQLLHWKDGGHAMIFQYPLEIGAAINNFAS